MARLAVELVPTSLLPSHQDVSYPQSLVILENTIQVLKSSESDNSWILDSGASADLTHDLENMINYQSCDVRVEIDKGWAKVLAFGYVQLRDVGDKGRTVTLVKYITFLK